MFYEKNRQKKLADKLFKNPTCEYRGTPFWAWNDKLNKDDLLWQIEQLKKMGLGGFHMHTRSGMATEYLGEEFMDLVKACVDKAKQEKMLAYLYDEDRWPSGAAGGIVTKTPAYRQKALYFMEESHLHDLEKINKTSSRMHVDIDVFDNAETATALKSDGENFEDKYDLVLKCANEAKPYLIACYDVELNEDGTLKNYSIIDKDAKAKGNKWYAYVTTFRNSGWYNDQTYVDTLSVEAMRKFIDVTYEAYLKKVGDEFGKTVPSIFTDEPQFCYSNPLPFAQSKDVARMAWTTDLPITFKNAYNEDLIKKLPEILWDISGEPARIRYLFRDHLCERFTVAFSDQCGKWCSDHGIALTGHVLYEECLENQTKSVGEAMRAYRGFGIPGIDMLCDGIELTTAKQTQSAVRQFGKEAMLSELYGVTGWAFDFRGHKFQGDWQAALGVSVRVHHLSWVSMKGSAKRDYPASIAYQSSWYKKYPYIEDHFARVNTVLTRGEAMVDVAVIHPIESYWLMYGPSNVTADRREQLENNFQNVTKWLLGGFIDFDFISESLLPSQFDGCENGKIKVGKMKYSTIIVPGLDTIRSSTVDALSQFVKAGGKVIFLGNKPQYVDARKSDYVDEVYNASKHVEFTEYSLMQELSSNATVSVINANGTPCRHLLYNKRKDNDCEWIFIAPFVKAQVGDRNDDKEVRKDIKITFKGKVKPTLYDTISGDIKEIPYAFENGNTVVFFGIYPSDSILLKLEKTENEPTVCSKSVKVIELTKLDSLWTEKKTKLSKQIVFKDKYAYTLGEDNVLVLDMPYWSEDGIKYNEKEEILRIDLALRNKYSYPKADGMDCQPWAIEEEKIDKFAYLKFVFDSQVACPCRLAFEEAEEVIFNGQNVPIEKTGYFTDKRIYTMAMPNLKKGRNELIIKAPFGKRVSIENYFILGKFGVEVDGTEASIVKKRKTLSFGSIVNKGLPFYGSTVTYKLPFTLEKESDIVIRADRYNGTLIGAKLDGKDVGNIVFAPYTIAVDNVKRGEHTLELTLYTSRVNSFSALHAIGKISWQGPGYWYKTGHEWSYEYQLFDNGIIKSPEIDVYEK